MSPIVLTDFGGEIPRTDAEKLPDHCAQRAVDCTLRGGTLAPLTIPNPILTLWSGSTLKTDLTASDVFTIAKPNAPTLSSLAKICQPTTWFRIYAYDWVSYIDATGAYVTTQARGDLLTIHNIVYTETGLWIVAKLLQRTYNFAYGGPYKLSGPLYQFVFYADAGGTYGGPDTGAVHPNVPSEYDDQFPRQAVALTDARENVYAHWQCVDYYGPNYSRLGADEILVENFGTVSYTLPGQASLGGYAYVAFKINLNYVRNTRRHYYYVCAGLTGSSPNWNEGPPSEISERITVRPGELPIINAGAAPKRLYRSVTGGDDFLKLDDIESGSTFQDWDDEIEAIPVPPYGNHPGTFADFTRGAFWHPGHFVVALYDGNLYMSDVFRGWAFPDEYTLPFPDAIAHGLTGNNILVWDGVDGDGFGWVYSLGGNHPTQMNRYAMTREMPLLNVKGLGRVAGTWVWPTYDGLAASSGSMPEIVTAGHFSREQWSAFVPSTMTVQTAMNSVLITCADGTKLRFDFDERDKALTRWTATAPASFLWKSKKFWHQDPVLYEYLIVTSAAAVDVTVFQDGVSTFTGTVDPADGSVLHLSGLSHSRTWEFQVEGSAAIRRIEVYEKRVVTINDSATLTPETSPIWESTHIKFPDYDRPCLLVLSKQSANDATVTLYADGVEATVQTVTSGRAWPLPRTLAKGTHWQVSLDSDAYVDELTLFRRTTQAVGQSLREIHGGGIPPWLIKRYEFPEDRIPRSVIVHASEEVTLNLYADGAETATESIVITAGRGEYRLTPGEYGFLEMDFGGDDAKVYEVTIFAQDIEPIPPGGLPIGGPNFRGRLFRFAEPWSFACAMVGVSSYSSVTLTLYADGVQVYQAAVTSGQAFSFPKTLARGLLWEVDLDTDAVVDSFLIMPWQRVETPAVAIRHTTSEGRIPPWMYSIYEFPAPVRIRSGQVRGLVYPVNLRLYADGSTSASQTTAVADTYEFRIASPLECRRLQIDFDADTGYDDGDIAEVMLFNEEVIPVEKGIILPNAQSRTGWRNKILQFPEAGSFTVARVVATDYTGLNLILRAGGGDLVDTAIADGEDFKVAPGSDWYQVWDMDLAHQGDIRQLVLIADDHYLLTGTAVTIRKQDDPWSWLQKKVICPKAVSFSALRVNATAYPVTVRVYAAGTLRQTVSVADANPVRLIKGRLERLWVFDFVPEATATIHEAGVGLSMGALR